MKVALIPARGGSKRIPRKNVKSFLGKPIIAYSIEAAFQSGCFDKVVVSTDDEEIAKVSREYGAETPFIRPSELSDDYATTMDVIAHALNFFSKNDTVVEDLCCIYATAPFLQKEWIIEGMQALEEFEYAFPTTTFSFPIQRAVRRFGDGRVEMFHNEYLNTRSQDLEEAYHDAGQFYCGRASAFSARKPIFSRDAYGILVPRKYVQDIDTPEDWDAAELAYRVLTEGK